MIVKTHLKAGISIAQDLMKNLIRLVSVILWKYFISKLQITQNLFLSLTKSNFYFSQNHEYKNYFSSF